ncbi:Ig-like domain-containing protein, partial [Samsonia erythrinae]
MNNPSVILKENSESFSASVSSGELNVPPSSIIKLQVSRQEIASLSRVGNDLVVTTHSGEKLVLKNFYLAGEHGDNELVLQEDDGALWWAKEPTISSSYESISSIDELMLGIGGTESSGAGIFPYFLAGAAGVAGIAGVVAMSSGSGGNRDLSANEPNVTAPAAPTVTVSGDGRSVSGTAETGNIIILTDEAGNELGRVAVGEDGTFNVSLPQELTNGEVVTVVVTDAVGNRSEPVTVIAPDTTPPAEPGELAVTEDGTSVSGTAEAGSTVTVTDGAGNELGRVTVGEDGTFNVPLSPTLTNGEAVTVVVTDAAGNVSESTTITAPDSTIPAVPGELAIAEDGTSVSGTAEAGSTVTVTDGAGNELGSVTVGEDGTFNVPLSPALTNGETITTVVTDTAGNVSESTTITAPDSTIPAVPGELAIAEDGTSVSGTAEAGSTVTVTDAAGNELGSVTVGEDGSFSVPLSPALTNGETITTVVTDTAGNVSESTTITAPDSTIPAVPGELAIAQDGTSVSGTAEAGSTVTVTDGAGNELGSVTVGEDGSFSVPLSPALTNGETITTVVTDAAGNVSESTTITAPDSTIPAVPGELAIAQDGTSVS